jgi:hypothetical protein
MESAHIAETIGELRRRNASIAITNVSLGGACIETETSLQPGAIMRLEFTLPSHAALATFAEVCWSNGKRIGMRFLALSDKGTTELRQYILRENHHLTHPNGI